MGKLINLAEEKHLSMLRQKLSEIYINNKIKLYESQERLSDLSNDEYFKYLWEKKSNGYVYFWNRDSFSGIWVGNIRVGISYLFDKDRFEGRFISLEGHGKVRLFDEKEFREEWRIKIRFDEKYLEKLINEKKIEHEEDYNP